VANARQYSRLILFTRRCLAHLQREHPPSMLSWIL
jgi:hypothetical protein